MNRLASVGVAMLCALPLSLTAQNVGIGVASPQQRLHVNGSIRTDNALVMNPPAVIAPGNALTLPTVASTAVIGNNAPTAGDLNQLTPGFAGIEGQILYLVNSDNDPGTFVPTGTTLSPNSTNGFLFLGGTWRPIGGGGTTTGWLLNGNSGTDATVNFVGTTDAQDLVLRTNSTERLRLTTGGTATLTADFTNQEHYPSVGTANQNISHALMAAGGNVLNNTTLGPIVIDDNGPAGTNKGSVVFIAGTIRAVNTFLGTYSAFAIDDRREVILTLQRDTNPAFSAPTNLFTTRGWIAQAPATSGNADRLRTGQTEFPLTYLYATLPNGTYYYRVIAGHSYYTGNTPSCNFGSVNFFTRNLNALRLKQ